MIRFFIKVFLTISILFIGVLAGMQIASERMSSMKGYGESAEQNAVSVRENDEGNVTGTFLGNELNTTVKMKQLELQKMHSFNALSSLGDKIADLSKKATEKGVEVFTTVVDSIVP